MWRESGAFADCGRGGFVSVCLGWVEFLREETVGGCSSVLGCALAVPVVSVRRCSRSSWVKISREQRPGAEGTFGGRLLAGAQRLRAGGWWRSAASGAGFVRGSETSWFGAHGSGSVELTRGPPGASGVRVGAWAAPGGGGLGRGVRSSGLGCRQRQRVCVPASALSPRVLFQLWFFGSRRHFVPSDSQE